MSDRACDPGMKPISSAPAALQSDIRRALTMAGIERRARPDGEWYTDWQAPAWAIEAAEILLRDQQEVAHVAELLRGGEDSAQLQAELAVAALRRHAEPPIRFSFGGLFYPDVQ